MQFQIIELKQLLISMQNKRIQHINIKSNNLELTVNTVRTPGAIIRGNNINPKITKEPKVTPKPKNMLSKKSTINKETETYSTIISPMVGTFYRSPAPSEPPFIEKNDLVQSNQTVCIIEAMKLMNEIEAEVTGEIVEILVQDGDIVDCGQALMKVKPVD